MLFVNKESNNIISQAQVPFSERIRPKNMNSCGCSCKTHGPLDRCPYKEIHLFGALVNSPRLKPVTSLGTARVAARQGDAADEVSEHRRHVLHGGARHGGLDEGTDGGASSSGALGRRALVRGDGLRKFLFTEEYQRCFFNCVGFHHLGPSCTLLPNPPRSGRLQRSVATQWGSPADHVGPIHQSP